MDELIKYFQQIEQRLAAAEQQLARQQERLSAQAAELDNGLRQLEQLKADNVRLAEQLSAAKLTLASAAVSHSAEVDENGLPEVEVELIVNDDEEDVAAPIEQPVAEEPQQPQATEVMGTIANAQPESQPQPQPQPEPQPQSQPQPEPQPQSQPQPESQPQPQSQSQSQPSEPKATLAPPISNIREAISIGDRFLFQRELFRQDGELMNKTIDHLNQLTSLSEAMAYIEKKFQWNTETPAYELFVNILKRRWQ